MNIARRSLLGGLLAAPLFPRPPLAAPPLWFSQIVELSGPAARIGDSWRNGVEMAVQEINAAGGLLGRPLQMSTFDSSVGRPAVRRALEGEPLALLGPVTPEAVGLAVPMARAAGITHIVGSDSPDPAAPAGATVASNTAVATATVATVPASNAALGGGMPFRTAPGTALRMRRLARWLAEDAGVRRVALVWSNGWTGRHRHDVLLRELRANGIEIASDQGVAPAPTGFATETATLARSPAEAAVVLLPEAECVRFLKEARRQGLRLPLVGDTTLAAPRVLAQAGAAAEGVRCHVTFTPEASELAAFRGRFLDLFKEEPDAVAAKGYTAIGLLAAGTMRLGRVDRSGLAAALRGLSVPAGAAAMMLDSRWNAMGEMDRASFLVEVRQGRPVVLRSFAPE